VRAPFLLSLCIALCLGASSPSGTLVIAGGGRLPPAIHQAFLEAAGGKGARVAVIPTASGVPEEAAGDMVALFGKLGAKVLMVDPGERGQADSWGAREDLKACTGFWFTGGDQNRVGDRIQGTALHQLILKRYQEGAAIGGTSAGAAIMSPLMLVGTDDVSETAPGTYKTRPGLGFLPGTIVDQHFLRRSRHNRLLSLLMDHPDLLGLGVDEETAMVVKGGRLNVIGNRRVLVLDPQGMSAADGAFRDLRVHLLAPGQGLDLATRRP
jgi:cyanophycinase